MISSRLAATIGVGVLSAALAGSAFAQVSDDVVKIGVLNDQSGLYSDITGQGSVIAAQMAAEDFSGTVLGKPIEIIFADHQNKPDVGGTIARKWIDQDHVDAIADVPAYVEAGGAIDAEARRRGQTLYAPDGRVPLHPAVLSEGAASLLPEQDRRAFVWRFVFLLAAIACLTAAAAVVGVLEPVRSSLARLGGA